MDSLLKSWLAEKQSAVLYAVLAQKEKNAQYSEMFTKLGNAAEEQAQIWEQQIVNEGGKVPLQVELTLRLRVILFLINKLGIKPLRNVLAAAKIRGVSVYSRSLPGHSMPVDLAEVGARHKSVQFGGNLRAAVFGINDGMVSNAALIFGIAGASSQDFNIVIMAGVAGLLAGAFSMAAGEYVSVKTQKDLFAYQIGLEAEELRLYPEEEAAELALIFEARGLSQGEAQKLSKRLISDPDLALNTLAREELGLDPDDLGSEYQAALFSFVAFSAGAIVPLLPFILRLGENALLYCASMTLASLFLTGAGLSLFTGRNAILSGLRMLLIGSGAAAITYWIGALLGVAIS